MSACGACKNLDGKDRRHPAHMGLKQVGARQHLGGAAIGSVVTYPCTACGSRLQLDDGKNDRLTGWTLAREA
ncbi:MAG: hypothetical protein JO218_06560 [Burkholderiales bacterium]|nr:hypothetical protein [Burkholderiales bacterium]